MRVPVVFEEDEPVVEDCCVDDEPPFEAGDCRAVCGLSEAAPPGGVGVGVGTRLLLEPVKYSSSISFFMYTPLGLRNCPSTPSFAFLGACANFVNGGFVFLPFRGPEGPSPFHGNEDVDVGFEEEVGCCGKRRALKSEIKESESEESPRKSYGSISLCPETKEGWN